MIAKNGNFNPHLFDGLIDSVPFRNGDLPPIDGQGD